VAYCNFTGEAKSHFLTEKSLLADLIEFGYIASEPELVS